MWSNFDRHIKSIFSSFKAEGNPDSWSQLEQRLDKEMPVESDPFDQSVKEKLDAFSSDIPIIPFSALASKIGHSSLDDSFDLEVKEKLENLNVPDSSASWIAMEQMLDKADAISFNNEVKEKVNDIKMPYESDTWPVLAEKIDKAEKLRRKIILTKISEVAVLLLLLVTVINFTLHPESIPAAPTVHEYIQKIQTKAEKLNFLKGKKNNTPTADYTDLNEGKGQIAELTQDIDFENLDEQVIVETLEEPINSTYTPIVRIEHEVVINRELNSQQLQANPPITSFEVEDDLIKIIEFAEEDPTQEITKIEKSKPVSAINIIQAGVALANEQLSFKFPSLVAPSFKAVQLDVRGNTDINFIETPYDEVYRHDPYNQAVAGYGGSINARIDLKTFIIETGIGYSKKQYHPKEVIEVFDGDIRSGYRGISLSQIEMDVLSIPLNLIHYVRNEGTWRFYSKVGASMHVIGLSDYHLQEYAFGGGNQPAAIPSENEADILEKDFESGIAQGGSFFKNTYFTLNMGLGVEKLVSDRYSIFAEPSYQHGIFNPQLGPNRDKIHNLSLSLGARVTL